MVRQIVFYGENLEKLVLQEHYRVLEEKPQVSHWQSSQKDTLFVFDDESLVNAFMLAGYYVVAYLHEQNKQYKFSKVPYLIEVIEEIDASYFKELFCRLAGLPLQIMETKRCILREITVEDVPRLYEIYGEESVAKYVEKLYNDIDEELAYTRDYIRKVYGFYGYGIWIVEEKSTGRIIGRAGVEMAENANQLEMGFLIEKSYQRKGFAYEVCTAILKYAYDVLQERKVVCLVREENGASRALCEKLGFVYEDMKINNQESYMLYGLEWRTDDSAAL